VDTQTAGCSTCSASFSTQWVWLCLLFTTSCFLQVRHSKQLAISSRKSKFKFHQKLSLYIQQMYRCYMVYLLTIVVSAVQSVTCRHKWTGYDNCNSVTICRTVTMCERCTRLHVKHVNHILLLQSMPNNVKYFKCVLGLTKNNFID